MATQEELILEAAGFVARGLSLPQYIREGLDAQTLNDLEDMRKVDVHGSTTNIVGKSRISQ